MNIKQANVVNGCYRLHFGTPYTIFIEVLGTVDFIYGPENRNNELKAVNFGVDSSWFLFSRCIINISGLNQSRGKLGLSIYV